jgi:hypothetical protein
MYSMNALRVQRYFSHIRNAREDPKGHISYQEDTGERSDRPTRALR